MSSLIRPGHFRGFLSNKPTRMRLLSILPFLGYAVPSLAATVSWITPSTQWLDTSSNPIDCHGGSILLLNSTFYWVGQSASRAETPMLYSSSDLLNWKFEGAVAPSVSYYWRPKLAMPTSDGSFWLFGQQDRYVLSLKSGNLAGGYGTREKVHLPPSDYSYSDTGIFYDEDSKIWYLLTSADHNTVQINRINADGTVGTRVSMLTGGAYEAPGLFKSNGIYFLIVSGKTGWRANPNKVFWSTSINGPWQGGSNIAPDAEKTYGSQNTFDLTIKGSKATTYIYMGDVWDSKGGTGSKYVWLPMKVDTNAKTVTLDYNKEWKVDVKTGEVTYRS